MISLPPLHFGRLIIQDDINGCSRKQLQWYAALPIAYPMTDAPKLLQQLVGNMPTRKAASSIYDRFNMAMQGPREFGHQVTSLERNGYDVFIAKAPRDSSKSLLPEQDILALPASDDLELQIRQRPTRGGQTADETPLAHVRFSLHEMLFFPFILAAAKNQLNQNEH
ncbi:MAG: hypothetical protein VKJ04_05030 [Vampirovibrionales bacterium]|nr:hypothetical protein [Vampirovibrionales bacterium]